MKNRRDREIKGKERDRKVLHKTMTKKNRKGQLILNHQVPHLLKKIQDSMKQEK
jgi:hypothetical protein